MAYDEKLAGRVRAVLRRRRGIEERAMFGGLAFLLGGHMCVGVVRDLLMVRVGPEGIAAALARPHARPMDFTGKPSNTMVYVAPAGVRTAAALARWVGEGVAFARSLPAKDAPAKRKTPAKKAPPTKGPAFGGFPPETFRFLRGVARNNSRAWFEAHKDDYAAYYVGAATDFVAAIGPRLARVSKTVRYEARVNGSLFRIQRDLRFVRDRKPYKDHLDMLFWEGERRGWDKSNLFVRLTATDVVVGVGSHRFDKPALDAYRRAVTDGRAGAALVRAIAKVEKAGPYEIQGAARKNVPRGFDPDHPRAHLLLHDGLVAVLEQRHPPEIASGAFVDWCLEHFARMAPLHRWLLGVV